MASQLAKGSKRGRSSMQLEVGFSWWKLPYDLSERADGGALVAVVYFHLSPYPKRALRVCQILPQPWYGSRNLMELAGRALAHRLV